MPELPLTGMCLLLLEDEFLIAMDVEQLCRDNGASDVIICKTVEEAEAATHQFDAAIVDMVLDGKSTLPFAASLQAKGIPFIFASGYTDRDDVRRDFPDVTVVGKPYSGSDIVTALTSAMGR